MLEEYKALVRRYYQETMGDLSGIEEIVASAFVDHHFPPEMPPGPAGVRKFFTEFLGSIFSDARIEIDFLLASQKANHIHAYEIKRGKVNRDAELNRLIGKTARLTFKSIKLHNPQITGEVLNLGDM